MCAVLVKKNVKKLDVKVIVILLFFLASFGSLNGQSISSFGGFVAIEENGYLLHFDSELKDLISDQTYAVKLFYCQTGGVRLDLSKRLEINGNSTSIVENGPSELEVLINDSEDVYKMMVGNSSIAWYELELLEVHKVKKFTRLLKKIKLIPKNNRRKRKLKKSLRKLLDHGLVSLQV